MINPIIWLILTLIDLYTWIIIAAVIASWLLAFGVVNAHNHIVRVVLQGLSALTDPVFRQVRRVIPAFGGIDISPVIVLIALQFLRYVIVYYSVPSV
ncbi:MAG TPA: YggT family protein [Rhizomicrobium sp.]|jgi:YggT family protein|nr:YggT family protein [Rhizomicrobium sp.]HEX4533822.1 YggT family protein [Rhizomicrobium sp.]